MRSKSCIDIAPGEPEHDGSPLRLDLGCGEWCRPGFIGVDKMFGSEVYPLDFPDNSADEIVASHILEHFKSRDTLDILKDWVRVLKPGGMLRVAVPDLEWIIEQYVAGNPNREPLLSYLFGGQKDDNDFHKAGFSAEILANRMTEAGLKDITCWKEQWNDCSSLEVSLNLAGIKCA